MKLALVYDRVNKWGGAERVLECLHQIWSDAPLYTAIYHPHTAPWAKDFDVRPSFVNQLPWASTNHEWYFWLMPLAFETLDLSAYEIVLSVCSDFTKGVITKPNQLHLSYIFSPTRYLWLKPQEYRHWSRGLLKPLLPPVLSHLRRWDYLAAQRPDQILTISQTVKNQIKKYYHRDSEVIYPPVNTDFFKPINTDQQPNPDDYYLIVSRLVPHKNLQLAIKVFNQLKLPLKIVGTGRQEPSLRQLAGPNIEFLGKLTDLELLSYYQNCRALIFPGEESFGLTLVEAQAVGKPVIAWRQGGATEIIIDHTTGLFFNQPTVKDFQSAVNQFTKLHFNWRSCRQNALKFSQDKFNHHMKQTVETAFTKHQRDSL